MRPLQGKKVVLGVSGSVAAYKAAWLASRLAQEGVKVTTILTRAALRFVSPLTFRSVTGGPAYTDEDLWGTDGHVLHVGIGREADLLIVAPATANTIAKLATGSASDLLSLTALSTGAPLLLAPAMDGGMFANPATQANLEVLRERGASVIGPASGHLASGLSGVGRMAEPDEILGAARYLLTREKPLKGFRVVVTAGGTREPLDPVRVLTNRSTGKQGFALAQAALDWGAEVTLISAPTCLKPPYGAQFVPVQTADEMRLAVFAALPSAHMLFMAAAVADYRASEVAEQKIKKGANLHLALVRTADILAEVAEHRDDFPNLRFVVGFAAESQNLLENARSKLQAKRLDMIAANDITAPASGFAADTNRVVLLFPDGRAERLPLMSKHDVAHQIVLRSVLSLQGNKIFHLVSKFAWEQAVKRGYYAPPSLDSAGFIHFSRADQVPRVADLLFAGRRDLLLLTVPLEEVYADLRWEEVGGDLFPHLYGRLRVGAVAEAAPYLPDESGHFPPLPWG